MKNTIVLLFLFFLAFYSCKEKQHSAKSISALQPNILFAISDDQSFPYASVYGSSSTVTPNFDAVAQRGVLFTKAFCAAPQCSPSRAAILTGRNIWTLEEAGTHSSYFPKKFPVFTDALESNGYQLGFTGKPWGPGNWQDAGWKRNPVGPEYNSEKLDPPHQGINNKDYAGNFRKFLSERQNDKPFFFWYGGHEPHRVFENGVGMKENKKLTDAEVPPFLPDDTIIRSDILDYAVEIQWFDQHLGQMLDMLQERGELENTIVVITADNGMAFPAAKANLHEYGTHVPLAICGPGIPGGRTTEDLVSLIDLAPTFLDLTSTDHFPGILGHSLVPLLTSEAKSMSDDARDYIVTGRERHTHARPDNLGYPARAIRTQQFLYIHNFKPDRWPAGDPEVKMPDGYEKPDDYKSMKDGYHDIDASPSKSFLLDHQDQYEFFFNLAVSKRPAEELYDISRDPGCTKNLADDPDMTRVRQELFKKLMAALEAQNDPRVRGTGDIFESYPRFASMRPFSGFKERGEYNPAYQK